MSADALSHQKGTLTSATPAVLPLVIGEPYLLIVGKEGDNFNSQTVTPELFTGVNGGAAAQGTLTLDTNPVEGDTITIGDVTLTYTAEGDIGEGKIEVAADLASAKTALIAAINGTAGNNPANPLVEAVGFLGDDLTLEARQVGTAGNAIVTTETFTAGTNVFDAGTLGTTLAGTDDYDDETIALPTIGSSDSSGSPLAFAAQGMVYFDAGLPNLILQPSGAVTSVNYYLTKVSSFRGLNVGR